MCALKPNATHVRHEGLVAQATMATAGSCVPRMITRFEAHNRAQATPKTLVEMRWAAALHDLQRLTAGLQPHLQS